MRSPNLRLWRRVFLGIHVFSWALCPLLNLLNWSNILLNFERSLSLRATVSLLYAAPCWGYLLGFMLTFSPSSLRHGYAEWLLLLFCQIVGIPLFAAMEAYGILLAITGPCTSAYRNLTRRMRGQASQASAFNGFAIVKKEGTDAKRRAAKIAAEVGDTVGAGIGGAGAKGAELASLDRVVPLATDLGGAHVGGGRGGGERYWRSLLQDAPPALQLPPADPPPSDDIGARAADAAALGAASHPAVALSAEAEASLIAAAAHFSSDQLRVSTVAVGAACLAWVAAAHARADEAVVYAEDGDVAALLRLTFEAAAEEEAEEESGAKGGAKGAASGAHAASTPLGSGSLASLARQAAVQLARAAEPAHRLPLARLLRCGPPSWREGGGAPVALMVSSSAVARRACVWPPQLADGLVLALSVPAATHTRVAAPSPSPSSGGEADEAYHLHEFLDDDDDADDDDAADRKSVV